VKTVPVRRRAIQGRWWGGRRRPSWGTWPWLASSAAADPAESGCTWLRACCTKQQRIQRLGGRGSRNQTNTGQIENVGIWTNSRKAEHRSRTGPDSLLQKGGGKALASPGNSSLNSQMKMRSGAKQFGIRGAEGRGTQLCD
jgi:hypothetical protein